MIKLIATDLDGTLLDSKKQLPPEIFSLATRLKERGVLFVPASGRQYASLKQLFSPVANDTVFLCENGALVKYKEKTLSVTPVEEKLIRPALDAVRSTPFVYPLLCCENNAYYENDETPFADMVHRFYPKCLKVDDLNAVIGKEPVCKISVFDDLGSANNSAKILPQKIPYLKFMLSGFEWCDLSSFKANKGAAIKFIREYFALKKEECVAFGDHMNDFEMLSECGTAYVPENAYPPLKELVKNTVPSNDEGGVLIKIKEILEEL